MRFTFGTVFVKGKWAVGEHTHDKNGVHFIKPLVNGFESQLAAYTAYQDWLYVCPVNHMEGF